MKSLRIFTILLCLLILIPLASTAKGADTTIHYCVSIHPLAAILKEITNGRAKVDRLLAPGKSPHTFEPTPSDLKSLEKAQAFFYVGPGLDGEWVKGLPIRGKIAMIDLIPAAHQLKMAGNHEHHHQENHEEKAMTDPHFWTDPLTVKEMVPQLIAQLGRIDPAGMGIYTANGERFKDQLDQLDKKLSKTLKPLTGEPLLLFHPSFNYLFHRYGLKSAGVVVESPGREPSPKFLVKLVKRIKAEKIKALFTEPQLAKQPAQVLAEAANIPVYEIDPMGGVAGRESYSELLLYNAAVLSKALH
ncbi:MAG: metal ABC transporter substrate-binding protein [Desulfobulbaceae bacterium]|nr:metal ABC transporter substrate-binding protein [Desulfobulbaceae bacterium]